MPSPEVGTIIDGKYRIVKFLGHGGFAGTYLADDLNKNIKVALKIPDINQLGDPAVYERFRRELSIGKLLQHPDLTPHISYLITLKWKLSQNGWTIKGFFRLTKRLRWWQTCLMHFIIVIARAYVTVISNRKT